MPKAPRAPNGNGSGFARARTNLGTVEERLRKALQLVGYIGAEMQEPMPIIPVVLADDATLPGCNRTRGRAFMFGGTQNPAAQFYSFVMRATEPVFIENVAFVGSAAHEVELRIAPNGTADPYALNLTQPPFVENLQTSTDTAPIVWGGSLVAAAIGARCGILRALASPSVLPVRVFLNTGQMFGVSSIAGVTAAVHWTFTGRLF